VRANDAMMKRWLIITINLLIMGFILFFIIRYANIRAEESNKNKVIAFEKMTMTTNRIITNYLEDEQHLCDIWVNYINRSAKDGDPMTAEEAITFIRKSKITSETEGHLVFPDSPGRTGISTAAKVSDPGDFSVSYKNVDIFDSIENADGQNNAVNLTRAYTNPMNGVQSIAFYGHVTVLDEESNELKDGLLMRVVPLSHLEQKLIFLKGEYEDAEISLVDSEGNYVIHGKSFKNSNFFEYYKSYNTATAEEYEQVKKTVTGGTGTMTIKNFKGEDCVLSYTPLETVTSWILLAYIPLSDLVESRSIDWLLLGIASLGFLSLLMFNSTVMMIYNRRLSDAALQANQANEAKSSFLSTMSHDIRTPMNAILGLNEMVLRDSKDEDIRMYSESIKTAGNTLLGIINDILDFSKIEAGKMEIINVEYSFASLLNDLVNMVQKKAEDKGLSFEPDIDRNIPSLLMGDEIRIKQIIINILSNAVKYTEEGSITFSVHARKTDVPDSVMLRVSVKDTGTGIKAEDLSRLFVAFERIDEKKNRNIEGTGLGMTIVQRFLGMMGSHLEVESEYGKGSVFSFDLEQKVIKWDPIGDFEEAFRRSLSERANYREKFTAPSAKVLVVDDTPVNLTVFVNLLKKTGLKIDTAGSGDEGMALFMKNPYDVIFLDHMMPDKDGIETLGEMKLISDTPNKGTPVICLTANAISGMRKMYIDAGFDDYLTKPIDAERLETMLLQYLPKEKVTYSSEEDAADDGGDSFKLPEFLYGLKELDVDSGLNYCGDGEDYLMTLEMFSESAEKKAEEIESYWKAGDIKNTTVKVHALKSASRAIGALELGEVAAGLETAGKDGDRERLDKDLGDLLSRYRKLAGDLKPLKKLTL